MNEAGPRGKGAREGTGGWGSAGGRRQGRVREVTGVLERRRGSEKAAGGQEARTRAVDFWVVAGNRDATRRLGVTISVSLG